MGQQPLWQLLAHLLQGLRATLAALLLGMGMLAGMHMHAHDTTALMADFIGQVMAKVSKQQDDRMTHKCDGQTDLGIKQLLTVAVAADAAWAQAACTDASFAASWPSAAVKRCCRSWM